MKKLDFRPVRVVTNAKGRLVVTEADGTVIPFNRDGYLDVPSLSQAVHRNGYLLADLYGENGPRTADTESYVGKLAYGYTHSSTRHDVMARMGQYEAGRSAPAAEPAPAAAEPVQAAAEHVQSAPVQADPVAEILPRLATAIDDIAAAIASHAADPAAPIAQLAAMVPQPVQLQQADASARGAGRRTSEDVLSDEEESALDAMLAEQELGNRDDWTGPLVRYGAEQFDSHVRARNAAASREEVRPLAPFTTLGAAAAAIVASLAPSAVQAAQSAPPVFLDGSPERNALAALLWVVFAALMTGACCLSVHISDRRLRRAKRDTRRAVRARLSSC